MMFQGELTKIVLFFFTFFFYRTVDIAHKLLARKCEKKYWKKRMFVILDLGKDIKDYLGKLDSVAADIQVRYTGFPCLADDNHFM